MATTDEETRTGEERIVRFFERLMELRPVEASYHGLHQHDRRLPDGSLSGVQELISLVRAFESELERLGGDVEADLARYWTGLTRFQLEVQRLWARRPEAVDQIGTGIFLLFVRDYAPLEVRRSPRAWRRCPPTWRQAASSSRNRFGSGSRWAWRAPGGCRSSSPAWCGPPPRGRCSAG